MNGPKSLSSDIGENGSFSVVGVSEEAVSGDFFFLYEASLQFEAINQSFSANSSHLSCFKDMMSFFKQSHFS